MDTQPTFAQFVYRGDLTNTVEAVTRVFPRTGVANGNAIVSLNPVIGPSGCNPPSDGMHLGGDADLSVTGGGLWSNGCMNVFGSGDVYVNDGSVTYYGTANNSGLDQIYFDPPSTPI